MPAVKGKRQERGVARRRAILDAAVQLFAERGFRSTGLAAVAERVGVTHQGVLHYFGTKENLLQAVIAERDRIEAEAFDKQVAAGGVSGLAALPEIARQDVANPVLVRLFTVLVAESLDGDDPLHDYFQARYKRVRRGVERMVRSGQDRGEIGPHVDPAGVAVEVLAFIIGIQTQWLLDPSAIDLVAGYESFTEGLLDRLATPTATKRG